MTTNATDPGEAATRAEEARRRIQVPNFGALLNRYWLVVACVLMIATFSILNPETFATSANLRFVITSQVVILACALAVMVPLLAGEFDISVGAIITLGSIAAAAVMSRFDMPLIVAIVATLALTMAIGAINGILVAFFDVNSLIATLGVAICIDGLVAFYTKGLPISAGISNALTGLVLRNFLGIPVLAVLVGIAALAVWYAMEHTVFGRRLACVGSNRPAAQLLGLRTRTYVFTSFVASGALAGIGGILMLAVQGTGNPSAGGFAVLLPGLAAVFLGATAFRPGKFNVSGTIVGIVLVAAGVSGLTLGNAQDWVQKVFTGGALVVAIAISAYVRRRRG